jgi:hypothetical protein
MTILATLRPHRCNLRITIIVNALYLHADVATVKCPHRMHLDDERSGDAHGAASEGNGAVPCAMMACVGRPLDSTIDDYRPSCMYDQIRIAARRRRAQFLQKHTNDSSYTQKQLAADGVER